MSATKGRWRKDKKIVRDIDLGSSHNGQDKLITQGNDLTDIFKNFTFSDTSRNSIKNVASKYAHDVVAKNQHIQCDGGNYSDFMTALSGGSIYIPNFFSEDEASRIYDNLCKDLKAYEEKCRSTLINLASEGAVDVGDLNSQSANCVKKSTHSLLGTENWSRHLKHEDPSGFPTFQFVIDQLSDYFDIEVFATRMNIYENGLHFKPHHHDSHSYSSEKNQAEDFTVGASFGGCRKLEFQHVKSGVKFAFDQKNGDVFGFNSAVNKAFTHGVPKESKNDVGFRISIIVWGLRRKLTLKNASASEIKKSQLRRFKSIR